MFEASGIIKYSPPRQIDSKWWLTIEVLNFEDTASYYRSLIDKNWIEADTSTIKRKYSRPPHPPHISIIRGEKPRKNLDQWGKYKANQKVNFLYSNKLRQTNLKVDGKDYFWFIDTVYEDYNKIRRFFGLNTSRNGVDFRGHITIARVY